jgi:large subunit ribosomal protein L4
MKTKVFVTKGKSTSVDLPENYFDAPVNEQLVAQAVKVYLSNQRKAYPKAKTRGEVAGSRKKIWAQKGTGNARHGDQYAPIFVGGGVAHGPKGDQNYYKKMPKKMKRKAVQAVLTDRQKEDRVKVVKDLKDIKLKTKEAKKVLEKIFDKELPGEGSCLLVLPEKWENAHRAFRNLAEVNITYLSQLNAYLLLKHEYVIFALEAIKDLNKKKNG